MYTIRIWNKNSMNFNANDFVRKNGTETFCTETEDEAIQKMYDMSSDDIVRQVLITPDDTEMPGDILFVKLLKLLFKD